MIQDLVLHIRKYVSISDQEIEILESYIKPMNVKKKTFLLKEGQVCKANYFVASGCLRMFFINLKGTEQVTQFALENWWIADQMSLVKHSSSQFFIQAVEDTELIAIEQHKEEELFKALPQLERYFKIMMQRAYAAAQMRVKFFHDYSKEESYRLFISQFPSFVQRIPQYMLASYLGLTPEYLSELRKKL